jgi:hypothetical protein
MDVTIAAPIDGANSISTSGPRLLELPSGGSRLNAWPPTIWRFTGGPRR